MNREDVSEVVEIEQKKERERERDTENVWNCETVSVSFCIYIYGSMNN